MKHNGVSVRESSILTNPPAHAVHPWSDAGWVQDSAGEMGGRAAGGSRGGHYDTDDCVGCRGWQAKPLEFARTPRPVQQRSYYEKYESSAAD